MVILCRAILALGGYSMQQNLPMQAMAVPGTTQDSLASGYDLNGIWTSEGVQKSERVTFRQWTNDRRVISLGTNTGAETLPYQDWCKIKEAFAPELIKRAIEESPIAVSRCIDPFGGSGTTGIACQFLGVHPVLAEVNPYLADLIEAKLAEYPPTEILLRDLNRVIEASVYHDPNRARRRFEASPPTLVEPGKKGRWIFNTEVACRIDALLDAIDCLQEPSRRLFLVLLGGVLIEVSNVRITGKGRRYRGGWENRTVLPSQVVELFLTSAKLAIEHIGRFSNRLVTSYDIRRRDCRITLQEIEPCQLAVFSPPYPNSFDYTDVYNVELWALGYLNGSDDNLALRTATLSSHVQVAREFSDAPAGSASLRVVLDGLESRRDALWDQHIPAMVGGYFSDLLSVLDQLWRILVRGATAWLVVGDSSYAGVQIPVAQVLEELVCTRGWKVLKKEPLREIRTSAQQGGEEMLAEQLLVLKNEP